MNKKIKRLCCAIMVCVFLVLLTLPTFAFNIPATEPQGDGTTLIKYYIEGTDTIFIQKDNDAYFVYNPSSSVVTLRLTLTNYYNNSSWFYLITSYNMYDNDSISVRYADTFLQQITFTFSDYFGGDYMSEYITFAGRISEDGTDDTSFGITEPFVEISINPYKSASFEFSAVRNPSPYYDPGSNNEALMTDNGLMAYTAAIYDIMFGYFGENDFNFFTMINALGQHSLDIGNEFGYTQGFYDGRLQGENMYYPEGYKTGYDAGYNAGTIYGQDSGYNQGVTDTLLQIGAEAFEGVTTFEEAYKLGVENTERVIQNNRDLHLLIPDLFSGIVSGIYEFVDEFTSRTTVFGLDVGQVLFTFIGLGLALGLMSFVVGKLT